MLCDIMLTSYPQLDNAFSLIASVCLLRSPWCTRSFVSWLLVLDSIIYSVQNSGNMCSSGHSVFDMQKNKQVYLCCRSNAQMAFVSSQRNFWYFKNLASHFCHTALLITPTISHPGYSANQRPPLIHMC